MLKYAEEQMNFGRWDGCPVVVIFYLYHIKIVGEMSSTMQDYESASNPLATLLK